MERIPAAALLTISLAALAATDAHAATRSIELPVPARAADAAGWRTPPLRVAGFFSLFGGEWRRTAGRPARVELRARRIDGRWTRWVRVVAGEPVWSGPAEAVQLRGARPVRGLRVHAVAVDRADAAAGAAATGAATTGAGARAAGRRPAIVPRGAWDPHHRCHPRVTARYGRVDFAVVHHTESLGAYAPSQSAAMVLGICLFHRDGNRWNDIGYDLLVDRYGTVFEGRAGGVEQPVTGAHAGGWNTMATGVAMIGSYTLATPPPAALRALERLLAWKLSLAGVPAQGVVTERSLGGVPGINAHPRGALVRFQRIAGHRDADFTDCPGGALYAQLPEIRHAVAALMAAPRDLLTLAPVGAPIEPAPWMLTGRLALASGRRPAGAAVRVEQRAPDGTWQEVALTRTGADGVWSAAPALSVNGALRAVATLPDGRELLAPAVDARVRAGVRLRAAPAHPRRGGTLTLSGSTSPPKARVRVTIERRLPSGDWRRVRVLPAATDASGAFAATVRLGQPGVYRATAATRADALNATGSSRAIVVRVLRR